MKTDNTKNSAKLWSKVQEQKIEEIASTMPKGLISNEDLADISKLPEFAGKTPNQIRSKTVTLGYYQKAQPKTASADGKPATVRKADYVKAIEILTGVKDLGTLEKASKPQLEALSKALTKLSDQENAKQGK